MTIEWPFCAEIVTDVLVRAGARESQPTKNDDNRRLWE